MSLNDLIKTQKRLRVILLICAVLMLGLAAFFIYNQISTRDSHRGWIITCLVMAAIGALTCIKLTLNITREEHGIASVQRIIDSTLSYLRTVADDGDARLYTGLVLTVMDHYMTPEDNAEIERIAAEVSLDEQGGSAALTACGERIVKTLMSRFENPSAGGASKYFKLSENERELYNNMSRRVLGIAGIENRLQEDA